MFVGYYYLNIPGDPPHQASRHNSGVYRTLMTTYSPFDIKKPWREEAFVQKDGQRPWNVVCHNFSKLQVVKKRSDIKWIKSGQGVYWPQKLKKKEWSTHTDGGSWEKNSQCNYDFLLCIKDALLLSVCNSTQNHICERFVGTLPICFWWVRQVFRKTLGSIK